MEYKNPSFSVHLGGSDKYRIEHERIFGPKDNESTPVKDIEDSLEVDQTVALQVRIQQLEQNLVILREEREAADAKARDLIDFILWLTWTKTGRCEFCNSKKPTHTKKCKTQTHKEGK